jgi:hypothetical protein
MTAAVLLERLDRLHHALRRGDLAALATLAEDIDGLCTAAGPVSPDDAALLRRAAERNAAALDAAARGVRAARQRLRDIRAARSGLRTYDRDGRGQTLAAASEPGRRL